MHLRYVTSRGNRALKLKPGLHKPQLQVERSVTLVSSIVVERRRCVLQVSSVVRLQENKETRRSTQLAVVVRVNQSLRLRA